MRNDGLGEKYEGDDKFTRIAEESGGRRRKTVLLETQMDLSNRQRGI